MRMNDRSIKQGDKLLKMHGKFDRGPIEFKSHIVQQEGEIMAIATRNVVSIPQTTSIMGAVDTMTKCGFRRLPVTDPGTKKLRGIITAGDVINFMGGGEKYHLVQEKHGGNLIAAVNESVREIMTQKVETLHDTAKISDAVSIIVKKKIGGLPIVDKDGALVAIATERDAMRVLAAERSDLLVEDIMTDKLQVTHPESPISSATRDMTQHRYRRLPVVSDEVMYGIITATDIMRYLGNREVFSRLSTGNAAEVMGLPVRTLLSGDLFTTAPEKSINQAAKEMLEHNIGALPVIEGPRLIGLVTEFDLVRAFTQE